MTTGRPTWERVVTGLSDDERADIIGSATWFEGECREGRHIMPSLRRDRFISEPAMQALASSLKSAASRGTKAVADDYRRACFRHVLSGGKITPLVMPKQVGRAIEETDFIAGLCLANTRILQRDIRRLVLRMASNNLTGTERLALGGMFMSPYAAWVTWDRTTGGAAPPFTFSSKGCADEIRASLGLPSRRMGKPILLVVYGGAAPSEIFRPTCADAGLYLRFEPPPAPPPEDHDHFGLTKPWEEFPDATYEPKPQPEGVHAKLAFPPSVSVARLSSLARPKRRA